MNIGLAIKSIAVERGMTAAALSRATGISEGYLSQLFHAKIEDPQLSKMWALSKALGVTVDEMVRAVRAVLSDAALVDDVVARVMDWQRRTLDSPDVLGARATLRSVAAEEERLLDAIQAGVPLDGIRPRVDALNERKRAARALLERREGTSVTPDAVRAAMAGLASHGTPAAILRHCVSGVVVDRDARAVVVTLPVADKKRAPTREGVSARSVWQPVGGHVSNVMWLVEGTTVMLRVPLAA